jgi:hypothetical protein
MKLQPLYDLQQEINRLFIAGSKFSKGDVRLQKYIPVLDKLGEKAPVFKKLSTDIEDLLQADSQQSAEKLMAISVLLYSVLYTQGETVESDAEEKPQTPEIDLRNVNTEYSYLQLKPVIEALTTSGSGRMEILKDAMERDIFKDSRTYKYLDIALGDIYSELCDFVEKSILPGIGKPIVPFLLQSFSYEDKTENIRRLRLLHKFAPERIPAMSDKILSESLPGLQAEVVNILSDDPGNEELIIKLADDKNKIVREAAYMALAKLNTRTSLEKLKEVCLTNKNKTNLPPIVAALASSKLPFFFQEILNQVSQSFEAFIALAKDTDDKALVSKLETFGTLLGALKNKDDEQIFDFFNNILQNKQYNDLVSVKKNLLGNLAYSVSQTIADNLNTVDKIKALHFYEENIARIPESYWKRTLWINYFHKAAESDYPEAKIFDEFGDLFKKNVIGVSNLYNVYLNNSYDSENEDDDESVDETVEIKPSNRKMDPRWGDLLYNLFPEKLKWSHNHELALQLLHTLEPKPGKRFNELLVGLTRKTQPSEQYIIFKLIMECEHPDRFELIHSAVSKYSKNTYYYILNRLLSSGFWSQFPKKYAAKFRDLYKQNKMEIFNEIADEIEKN